MTIGYIGSYTKKNGKGIYRFELNELEGLLKTLKQDMKLKLQPILLEMKISYMQ